MDQKRTKSLEAFAKLIQEKLPKSEQWFQQRWSGFKHPKDEYNIPFAGFIPDCINHEFKYIIEVDGSVHETDKQVEIDARKNLRFAQKGYRVFRVRAYDEWRLSELMKKIDAIRKPAVIIKKLR